MGIYTGKIYGEIGGIEMISEMEVKQAFVEKAKENGYTQSDCVISRHKDFKCKWTRTTEFINFDVSDFLMYVPVEVCSDIADVVCKRIKSEYAEYSDKTCECLLSKEFLSDTQSMYLDRKGAEDITGKYQYVIDTLVKEGKVSEEDVKGLVIAHRSMTTPCAYYSTLFRTICMSDDIVGLDEAEGIIKYELCKLLDGMRNFKREVDTDEIMSFEDMTSLSEKMEEMGIRI